jgi:hypothetical protein
MKGRKTTIILSMVLMAGAIICKTERAEAQSLVHKLLNETIKFYQHCRVENGLYLDRLSLESTTHPDCISISSTGVGLLSQVISLELDLTTKESVVADWKQTLQTLLTNKYMQESRINGFYSHWYTRNGIELNYSEISTVDNAILQMCLFWGAEKLQDNEINNLVLKIYESTNWPIIIYGTTGVYREISKEDGTPLSVSTSFSEYCIPAYLASMAAGENGRIPEKAFETFFPSLNAGIPRYEYANVGILSDSQYSCISPFVPQFAWFFCPPVREDLRSEITLFQKTDSMWFDANSDNSQWQYGLSAGSGYPSGYEVNKLNSNPDLIVSPSSVAGYVPCSAQVSSVLDSMNKYNVGRYLIPGTSDYVLWRYSLIYGNYAKEIQSIDMTGLLFGTAYAVLGSGFFDFQILSAEHPLAFEYSVFSSLEDVSDIEISNSGQVFILNDNTLYYRTEETSFSQISVPDEVNELAISDSYIYTACNNNIFKIPLNDLKSIITVDSWSWDEYTHIQVKSGLNGNDTLLYFINSFGSRSGWTIQYPDQTRINFTWGHYYFEGFFDEIADSLIYVSSSVHERYNTHTNQFTDLNVSLAGAFHDQENSLLVSKTQYSTDYGTHFQDFTKPFGMETYNASGFCQINASTLAFSDNYQDRIMCLENGLIIPTCTQVPDQFYLKAYDGEYLWGWVGTSSGTLVAVPFSDFALSNYIDFPPPGELIYYSTDNNEIQLSAQARYGSVKFKSLDESVAYIEAGNNIRIIADGIVFITAYVTEYDNIAYIEKSHLFAFKNSGVTNIVNGEVSIDEQFKIYPNPIKVNSMFLVGPVDPEINYKLIISDLSGKLYYQEHQGNYSDNMLHIAAPDRPGLYIVTLIKNGRKKQSCKIIVLH